MDELNKALAAMDAIFNLIDSPLAKLTSAFDAETGEHVITLEYRCLEPADVPTVDVKFGNDRQARSVLRYLLAST